MNPARFECSRISLLVSVFSPSKHNFFLGTSMLLGDGGWKVSRKKQRRRTVEASVCFFFMFAATLCLMSTMDIFSETYLMSKTVIKRRIVHAKSTVEVGLQNKTLEKQQKRYSHGASAGTFVLSRCLRGPRASAVAMADGGSIDSRD